VKLCSYRILLLFIIFTLVEINHIYVKDKIGFNPYYDLFFEKNYERLKSVVDSAFTFQTLKIVFQVFVLNFDGEKFQARK